MSPIIRTVCAHDCPDMCSLLVHVEDNQVLRIQGDPAQPFTAGFVCAKVSQEPRLVHSPDRLTQPLRRSGVKGMAQFTHISWAEALDEIVDRWKSVMKEDGPEAILGYCYSAHQGQFNRGLPLALFDMLGATKLIAGTVCDTCADEAWESTLGPVGGTDPEVVGSSDLIIAWGADIVTTNVHFWAKVQQARRGGTKLVVIDPYRSRTAAQSDWHVQPRIGSDAALALSMMHVLDRDGFTDANFIQEYTNGFERLRREVLPKFSPVAAEPLTGVLAGEIERLAHLYGRALSPFIRIGLGMSRQRHGGQAVRAVALLPGVTGAYARPGAGALMSTAAEFDLNYSAIRAPSGQPPPRTVNHALLGNALLELRDPPIQALFISGNNPAVTCPDAGSVRRGLSRQDLFTVVHDPFLSATAKFADIVLPAAMYLESDDVYRSYGTFRMQYGAAAIEPPGQAWSNRRLAQELARRLEIAHPVFDMDTPELLETLLHGSRVQPTISSGNLLSSGSIKLTRGAGPQEFRTPSGRLEFWQDTSPTSADWTFTSDASPAPKRWPLQLLTTPGYFQSHSAFSGNRLLRSRQGAPVCLLSQAESDRRGLRDGDEVELFNAQGHVTLKLAVNTDLPNGIVVVPGQQPELESGHAVINVLCSSDLSDMGDGATYQSTFIEVRRHPK
ncbi:MAG: molybdopterin-dependent oxidoreductase [Chloroflexota bacterium]